MLREITMETVTDQKNLLTAAQIAKTQKNTDEDHEMHHAMMGGYERCVVMYEQNLERDQKMIADLNKVLAQKEEKEEKKEKEEKEEKKEKEVIIANLSAEKMEMEALIAAKIEENAKLSGALADQKNRFNLLFASVGSGVICILLKNLFPKKKN